MELKVVSELASWLKETDLTEIIYKKGDNAFEIRTQEAHPVSNVPSCSFVPVSSTGVGIYRQTDKGKTSPIAEGSSVTKGQQLGYVEVLKTKKPVASPVNGFVRVISVTDGEPVEYGQPIMFVEPV